MISVDVIIPVFNQLRALKLALEGFARQTMPMDRVSICLVDDGSTEPVGDLAASFADKLPLRYVRLSRSGRAAARNAGVRAGTGDLLVFCDADRIPRPAFLEAHWNAARERSEGAICVGQVREMYVPDLDRNESLAREQAEAGRRDRIPQFCNLAYRLFDEAGRTSSPVAWIASLTGNLSVPRSLFERIGGFDDGFRDWGFEHFEFGFRGALRGAAFRYVPGAVNVHLAHPRPSRSYVEHIRQSHAYFLSKHRDPGVEKLLDFMLGHASLPAFEAYAAGALPPEEANGDDDRSLYVRISNF